LSASRKRDSSPPEAIGLHPELDAVDALRPRRLRVGFDLRHEFCAFEF
jgi:hypothetical protein